MPSSFSPISEKWDVTSLKRQKKSALFLRLAANKNKNEILRLAKDGITIETPSDVVKDFYTLDFMNLPSDVSISETELEKRLMKRKRIYTDTYYKNKTPEKGLFLTFLGCFDVVRQLL